MQTLAIRADAYRFNSYFNTVGSKEGWTPSTFVSSKSNRKKDGPPIQQKPEDFMDEEDLAQAEESRNLATSDTFAGLGSTEEEVSRRGGAMMDILRASGDTMGIKLLRRMGWREGQGIGPKVRRKARLDEGEDGEAADGQGIHLFAPENSQMISFARKNDRNGIGYEGEGQLADISSNGAVKDAADQDEDQDNAFLSRPSKKGKPKVQRGGFGVGVLNDGSDDEDPYHLGPQISYNRIIGGDKKKKKKPPGSKIPTTSSNPLLRTKPVFISKKAASFRANTLTRRCHDGRLPLEGFVLSTDSSTSFLQKPTNFPPPTIPPDWKSSKTPKSTTDPPNLYTSSATLAKSSTLTPSTRATLLGEIALPGKSVFDYLTPSARDRLANLTHNPHLPPALSEAPPPDHASTPSDLVSLIPSLDPTVATTALGRGVAGWMPYAEDPAKRARYRFFLEYRGGLSERLPERVEGVGTQEWMTEMREFAQVAERFKPMSGMMASRFMNSALGSAGSASSTAKKVDGGEGGDGGESLLRQGGKPKDPAEEAAGLGMYGPLTRTTGQFFPTRLLCKRFNVPVPAHVIGNPAVSADPSSGPAAHPSNAGMGAQSEFVDRFKSSGFQTSSKSLELVGKKEMEALRRESGFADVTGGEKAAIVVDLERNEALEKERPGEAVFRAIFGSDSEDD